MNTLDNDSTNVDPNCCQECGARVSPRWRKVFGNNEDEVYGCPSCTNSVERRCGHTRAPEDGEVELRKAI